MQVSVDDVQIRSADTASPDLGKKVATECLGQLSRYRVERSLRRIELHGHHTAGQDQVVISTDIQVCGGYSRLGQMRIRILA